MRLGPSLAAALAGTAVLIVGLAAAAPSQPGDDPAASRSAEMFLRMMPVLQSPRCTNCHTATGFPRQGDDGHRHIMLVVRGADDHGSPALRCKTCHQDANPPNSGVPGAPDWHLAPLVMAWDGLSAGALCTLFLDPRAGGLTPQTMVAHMQTPLVQWAWSPGPDLDGHPRAPPPISSADFIDLTRQWVRSGASCPPG